MEAMPSGTRFMRHEAWEDALFVHYPADAERLQALLPPGLLLDLHEGTAYIGVVCLTESGIIPAPPGMPLWMTRCLGLSHHAVNVRTYVRPASGDGPPGIFFFSLDCSALLPCIGARLLFNLPYQYSRMSRSSDAAQGESLRIESDRFMQTAGLAVEWASGDPLATATADGVGEAAAAEAGLCRFFVERYALYNTPGPLLRLLMPRGARLWSGTITHEPWPMRRATLLAYGSFCSGTGVLAVAGGLHELVVGGACIAHASRGVGPVEFFWSGTS